jgi:hypothetical protein
MFDAWPIHERDANAPPLDSTGAGQLGGIIDSLTNTILGNYRYRHSEEPAKMWPSMTKGSTILVAC